MAMPKEKRNGTLINFAAVMLGFVLLYLLKTSGLISNYYQGIIIQCFFTIIMVASLNIATGYLGQLALGHAGFMAIGAYTSALVVKALTNADILNGGTDLEKIILLVIGIACGATLAAIIGALVGIPALRLRGDYLAIITLGFGEIIRVVIQNLKFAGGKGLAAGQAGQALIGIKILNNVYFIYFIMAASIAILFCFVRSKSGRAIVAIREDDIASEASGVNNTHYKVMAFTIAAFFAGVAGAIFAHRGTGTIQPADFTFMKSTEYVIMVVIGGMSSLTGSVIAAVALSIIPEILRAFSEYRMLVYSVLLIIMMIFRPIGLCGRYEFSLRQFLIDLPQNIKNLPRNLQRFWLSCLQSAKDFPGRVKSFFSKDKGRDDGDNDETEAVV
ncbi:MAG: branched-chain amino acid ABC transporter permease [Clostridia bacterium]|jgi:branched-chain amino acid transport system permease protein|nr:branched-chain amino acid ABC transporter permease [Clostridia bacterium]